jgi:hypothetical protein
MIVAEFIVSSFLFFSLCLITKKSRASKLSFVLLLLLLLRAAA